MSTFEELVQFYMDMGLPREEAEIQAAIVEAGESHE